MTPSQSTDELVKLLRWFAGDKSAGSTDRDNMERDHGCTCGFDAARSEGGKP